MSSIETAPSQTLETRQGAFATLARAVLVTVGTPVLIPDAGVLPNRVGLAAAPSGLVQPAVRAEVVAGL
jgi:hypothetical protein